MTIATLSDFQIACQQQQLGISPTKINLSGIAGRLSSLWVTTPDAGVAPTTAVIPTSATAGALPLPSTAAIKRLVKFEHSGAFGMLYLADRLSHQGGLSGIVTTAQTTNLPTAALTRYTGGDGVWIGLEIYTLVGTTATTVTASYTNQAGTPGRTTVAVVLGGTGFREVGRVVQLPLQSGDTGVRSVESVTVLASTLTAGNFGVTLFRPLMMLPMFVGVPVSPDMLRSGGCQMPPVGQDACLQWMFRPNGTSCGPFTVEMYLSIE